MNQTNIENTDDLKEFAENCLDANEYGSLEYRLALAYLEKPTPPQADTPIKGAAGKPAVFYCENGKSLEGLEQGALAVLSNLMMKTNSTTAEFMIGNEKDGEFYFTCSRTKPTPAPIDADKVKVLDRMDLLDDKIKAIPHHNGTAQMPDAEVMWAALDFYIRSADTIRAALKKGS